MVLVLNVIFSMVRSMTFKMLFLHLFPNWNIFCISVKNQHLVNLLDLAMLCYYKVYYFRTLLAMFHSHFPSFT